MEQIGKVISVQNTYATVQIKRATACGENCAKCHGCDNTNQTLKVRNNVNANINDIVKFELNTSKVLLASFLVYILPIITCIIGYAIFGVIIGITFLIVPFVILWAIDKKSTEKYTGTITMIIDRDNKK